MNLLLYSDDLFLFGSELELISFDHLFKYLDLRGFVIHLFLVLSHLLSLELLHALFADSELLRKLLILLYKFTDILQSLFQLIILCSDLLLILSDLILLDLDHVC